MKSEKHAYAGAKNCHENVPVVVDIENLTGCISWRVTVVAYDYPGELVRHLRIVFVHGLDIMSGYAFTYEPIRIIHNSTSSTPAASTRDGNNSKLFIQIPILSMINPSSFEDPARKLLMYLQFRSVPINNNWIKPSGISISVI